MYACVDHSALAGGQCTSHVDHSELAGSSDAKEGEGAEEASRNIVTVASSSIAPAAIPGITIIQSECSVWPQKSNDDKNHAVVVEFVIVSGNQRLCSWAPYVHPPKLPEAGNVIR